MFTGGATPLPSSVPLPGTELFPFGPPPMGALPPGGLLPLPNFLPHNGLLPFAPHSELTKNSVNPYDTIVSIRNLQSSVSSIDASSVRLSPSSSRHSVSPERSKSDVNSTHDATISDESDEEPIEVVKSAFHPTKPASVELQEMKRVQAADSTVSDRPRQRNELKSPAIRTSRVLSTSPQSTKISNSALSTHKAVWRPY